MVYEGFNKVKFTGETFEEAMKKNYIQIQRNMESLKYQTKLNEVNLARWAVAVMESEELHQEAQVDQVLVAAE